VKRLVILIIGTILFAPIVCLAGEEKANECAPEGCEIATPVTGAAVPEGDATEAIPTPESNSGESAGKKVAGKVERATHLSSIFCGISPAAGLAALPCLTADAVNFTATAVGWIVRHAPGRNENREGD
jgi:hypothetical protein